jgi:TRAP transporter 4TM/12TM fusion protein
MRQETTEEREVRELEHLVEEVEYGSETQLPGGRWVLPVLAGVWSLFQLALPYNTWLFGHLGLRLSLHEGLVRSVHLSFAIALVYLSFPHWRRRSLREEVSHVPLKRVGAAIAYVLAGAAALAAAYYALDYEGIAERGMPGVFDRIVGVALLLLLLEAARRSLGWALPVIATVFVTLCFFGPELPTFMAFKRVSLDRMISQLTMSSQGIYGLPLGVSASTVFLFVLLGSMLEKSGGGHYFVNLAFSLLGGYRGGPAKAAVLSSGLTGLVSGSSIANTVTTGTFTIPLMKRAGYPAEKAAAVEVAASTNGQLMPPIMGAAAFIIASTASVEYLAVVRAAFVPAIVSYLALIYITHLEACKLGLQGVPKNELPRFWATFLSGLHFLLPLGLLVSLLVQRFSAELAAFWAIILLGLLVVIRESYLAKRAGAGVASGCRKGGALLWESLVSGGRSMMGIGVACATAGIIVGVMTLGPGSLVTDVVARLAGGRLPLLLLLTAGMSLVLGMGLPTTANFIVVSTVVAPSIAKLSGMPLQGVESLPVYLFCFFFGILADDTPPVGLAAYAASAIAKSDPIRTGIQGFTYDLRTAILPFMFFFNHDLLLIGVHSPWRVVWVFGISLVAMFAFASVTQNYLLRRNRWYESCLLAVGALVLFRPGLLTSRIANLSELVVSLVGLGLCAAVVLWQWFSLRRTEGGDPSFQ